MPQIQNFVTPNEQAVNNGLSGLTNAIIGNPLRNAQLAQRFGSADASQARANRYSTQDQLADQQAQSQNDLASTIGTDAWKIRTGEGVDIDPTTGQLPSVDQRYATYAPDVLTAATRAKTAPASLGDLIGQFANAAGASDAVLARNASAQAKGFIGKDQAVSLPGQTAIRDDDQDNAVELNQLTGANQLANTAASGANALKLQGARPLTTDEVNAKVLSAAVTPQADGTISPVAKAILTKLAPPLAPVTIPAGGQIAVDPNDPRTYSAPVTGAPTKASVEGQVAATVPPSTVAAAMFPSKTAKVPTFTDPKAFANGTVFDPVSSTIDAQLGGQDLPIDTRTAIKARAVELANVSGNLPAAVQQAIAENTTPTSTSHWYSSTPTQGRAPIAAAQPVMPQPGGAQAAAPPAAAGPAEGQTATNPKTGQRLMFHNGQWMPAA